MARDDDTINWTVRRLEARLNVTHATGTREGVRRCANMLRKKAGEKFAEGQDAEAKILRAEAERMDEEIEVESKTVSKLQKDLAEIEEEEGG